MEETLIAVWRKLKAALKHIEDELGFVPDESGTVTADSGGNGPPPPPPNGGK